jgi:integrase
MPKLVNKVPKFSLHKATGQAKVRWQGKDHYLGRHGSPEAWERYCEFIAKLPKPEPEPSAPPEPQPGEKLFVTQVVEHFYFHAKSYYVHPDGTPTGEHVTIRCALKPLKDEFGEQLAQDFGPRKLKQLQQIIIKLGWSRRYVNKVTNIVRRCFKWAASEELIPGFIPEALRSVDAIKKGRSGAREKPEVTAVADDVVDATLPELPAMVAAMVRIQRLTGMRPGEILKLTPDQIDRSDPELWVYRLAEHKTAHHGKGRTIMIGPQASAILAPWLFKAGEGRIFRIYRDGYRQAIIRACARAFPHAELSKIARDQLTPEQTAELRTWNRAHQWHPNQLHHTYATEVRRKYGLEAAQVLLGHSRADVTQTYAERDLEKARQVARKIG